MSETFSTIGSLTEINNFNSESLEPQWLQEVRLDAWKAFKELPWESDSNMLNFVDKRNLESLQVHFPPKILSSSPVQVNIPENDNINLYFSPNEVGSSFPAGISASIQKAIEQKPLTLDFLNNNAESDKIQIFLNTIINDKLASLSKATFEWGSFIQLKSNQTIETPITVRYDARTEKHNTMTGLHFLDIKDNVQVSLELFYDSADQVFDYCNTIIRVGTNSHINILVNDAGIENRKTVRATHISIGKNASVNFAQLQTEGQYIRQRSQVHFTEQGGELGEIACIRGYKKQIYDFYSAVSHEAPNTTSRTIARGVMDDEALGVFKGMVDIKNNAPQSNSDLSLAGLLLSVKARFHAMPAMEAANSNVIATHGAAISKIDPEILFYLQSRGIDKDEAEHMVSNGFFAPAIEKIRNNYLRNQAYAKMQQAIDEQFD